MKGVRGKAEVVFGGEKKRIRNMQKKDPESSRKERLLLATPIEEK